MNFRPKNGLVIFTIATLVVATFSLSALTKVDAADCNLPENREYCLAELAKIEAEVASLNTQLSSLKKKR